MAPETRLGRRRFRPLLAAPGSKGLGAQNSPPYLAAGLASWTVPLDLGSAAPPPGLLGGGQGMFDVDLEEASGKSPGGVD
ncbi:hypothetical protein BDY21DRAFT_371304 [Lineolata rhizophorae]|uniref:Uncharacterized protein n=1 Tax=Lineolata rhizophorae TaxID=578093 RepID=A0A6A6P1N5_9PEZI|nr:hypothetical protein BDY21DRAFT_371304 [Lineolata rhizophorae]